MYVLSSRAATTPEIPEKYLSGFVHSDLLERFDCAVRSAFLAFRRGPKYPGNRVTLDLFASSWSLRPLYPPSPTIIGSDFNFLFWYMYDGA